MTSYPQKIVTDESFAIKGEYLIENPQGYQEIKILLAVKGVENAHTLIDNEKTLIEDKTQQFTFNDLILHEIDSAVYFELKLVADGPWKEEISTQEAASEVMNFEIEILRNLD